MHAVGTKLDSIDDAGSDDGIHEEFNNEVYADDGKDKDEWVRIGSDMGDDGCAIEEEAEGSHEEDGVEQSSTGTADEGGKDSFFVLDLDGIIDDTSQESDKNTADDSHDDEAGEESSETDFAIGDTALENICRGIDTRECLDDGDDSPKKTGKGTHDRAEYDSHDADGNAHQCDGQTQSLDGADRCESKDKHDGDHNGGYGESIDIVKSSLVHSFSSFL